jgi:hypothetical protein
VLTEGARKVSRGRRVGQGCFKALALNLSYFSSTNEISNKKYIQIITLFIKSNHSHEIMYCKDLTFRLKPRTSFKRARELEWNTITCVAINICTLIKAHWTDYRQQGWHRFLRENLFRRRCPIIHNYIPQRTSTERHLCARVWSILKFSFCWHKNLLKTYEVCTVERNVNEYFVILVNWANISSYIRVGILPCM